MLSFKCKTCGETHHGLPDLAFDAPYYYQAIAQSERGARTKLTADFCQVDDHYFIRTSLEIPIIGQAETFSYGVWLSVSEKNFLRYWELFDVADPPQDRYVGWVANQVPGYPNTLELKGAAHTRKTLRPYLELEPSDHPLAVLQRDGIDLEDLVHICSEIMHRQPGA